MNSLVRSSFKGKKVDVSLHDSFVRRKLATSNGLLQFDRRQVLFLPLWISEALGVARVAKGEPAGARFTTRPTPRTFRRRRITDENILVF